MLTSVDFFQRHHIRKSSKFRRKESLKRALEDRMSSFFLLFLKATSVPSIFAGHTTTFANSTQKASQESDDNRRIS